ncbi:MAG TPA: hypothetical protein VNK82_09135 [Terriglobales bacterium]|nr:hypothetical protein [Terriglobales bacterium]
MDFARLNAKPLVYGSCLTLLVFMLAPRGVALTPVGRMAALDNPANDDASVDVPKGKREATPAVAPQPWRPPAQVVGRVDDERPSCRSAQVSFVCKNRAPPTR